MSKVIRKSAFSGCPSKEYQVACEVCTERGVGIEYECRTLPPDCERSFTKEDQLRALRDDCLALPGLPDRVAALLRRL